MGNNVTNIGVIAFGSCTRLTSITIPSSVTSIGIAAFQECRSLKSVDFWGNVPEDCPYLFFVEEKGRGRQAVGWFILGGLTVTSTYDQHLRRYNLSLNSQPSGLSSSYGYDAASRLQTVGDRANNSATYSYLEKSIDPIWPPFSPLPISSCQPKTSLFYRPR
jgi:hypothetical protein